MSTGLSRTIAAALAGLLTVGSGVALASPGAATESARARLLTASLAGSSAGDADGSGQASLVMRARRSLVCADMSWSGIQRPSAAHIHRASDGAVVVTLTTALADGSACVGAPTATIRAINANPRAYYVNLHNSTHSGGAIQGALR